MSPRSLPPEEKLLRLIRGKGQPGAPANPSAQAAGRARGFAIRWPRPDWSFGALNVVLGCAVLAEVSLLVAMWVAPEPPTELIEPAAASAEPPPAEEMLPSLAASTARPLFRVAEAVESSQPAGLLGKVPSVDVNAVAQKMSLIGVITGDPPQAIIEVDDNGAKKTQFVTVGQSVRGATVKDIQSNHVVLDLNGEKIDLSL